MPVKKLHRRQNFFQTTWETFRTLCLTIPLFSLLLLFNALQMALLLLRPFSQKLFRQCNRNMANFWWGLLVTLSQKVNGVKIITSGDEVPPKENAILVSNHLQMTDIPILLWFAKQKLRLGDMKWFIKDIIKYVPGVGWGLMFLDALFVKRNWNRDKAKIQSTFRPLVKGRVPFWVISFSEGTRLTESKLQAAQDYARKKGLPPLKEVLYPRPRGFVAMVQQLGEQLDAIYDVTIGYPEGVPTLWSFFKGHARLIHLHIARHPISSLPQSESELSQWLVQRFVLKDQRLQKYYAEQGLH